MFDFESFKKGLRGEIYEKNKPGNPQITVLDVMCFSSEGYVCPHYSLPWDDVVKTKECNKCWCID